MLAALAGILCLSACENDLKAIQKISAQEVSKPISTTTGLDVITSDSAVIKMHLTSPLLIEYLDKHFQEMPKGLKIISYDSKGKEEGEITADYGIQRENENIIELRRNVVCKNSQGETFKSDELIWDKGKRTIYSNKPVQISFSDGTILYGTGADSNESMYPWTIKNTTGQIPVNQNFGQ
ncbi:LPS export ABC transporter periplasmic protein LptC [Mucilaginibacter terrae]|uniref:LPS export ABC transporter protein LptC n=1 Tax=Mucilaginibacter terrae TaxID=1955052 RepID=A0ABU3GT42_9SPHI|nr:LPS export ABC transporter periplasmic protein LptC [Mucilaginibacter terrae]MDT3402946.1 LPS export ABC transporter protein LptC [Mucilaginibacter terrae]